MKKRKRLLSLFLALTLCFGILTGIAPRASAASVSVLLIDYPRLWDASTQGWGHPALNFLGGWSKEGHNHGWTFSMRDSFNGDVVYCLEPGMAIYSGDTLQDHGEDYWDNYPSAYNQTISPTVIKAFIGRIMQYGWQGHGSDSWSIHNAQQADNLAAIIATQMLVWETVVGERDASFNHVDAHAYGKNNVTELILDSHPLRVQIFNRYDAIVASVQQHSLLPSFFSRSPGAAESYELQWNGNGYALTLTDTNGVLGNYRFTGNTAGVIFSTEGNQLTILSAAAPSVPITVTAEKTNGTRTGVVVWSDGNKHGGTQDIVTYGASVTDPVAGYLNLAVSSGSMKLVKTAEDGVVEGFQFTITGNGVSVVETTNSRGEITVDNLNPGVYSVAEQTVERYAPADPQQVTIVSGQTATVYFNNTLKRGTLRVTKSSEDGLSEGVTFHLSGTSLSGLPVDEYAVTGPGGTAEFVGVLIGSEYTLEEVDTPSRYVIPSTQTVSVAWNEVTAQTVTNVLKKFGLTVTKSDAETGIAQGDASLAGAVYGLYRGETLVESFTTGADGSFVTGYYPCGDGWTLREITPSEGYLLDETIYPVGEEPGSFTEELNSLTVSVKERVLHGTIALIKHSDDGSTQIETPEVGATFAVYKKSAGSYDAAAETERDFLTCNEEGFATTTALPYGIYTVEQLTGWDGRELMPAFDVYISQDGAVYRYLINNAFFQSYIKVVKKDVETGAVIPYAGSAFRIYDPEGQPVSMTLTYPEVVTLDTFYTNVDGALVTPETLPYGTGYTLVEVQAPYGYVLDQTPIPFNVTESASTQEGGITVVEVIKTNAAQKGVIRVEKTGEVFASVHQNGGVYLPVYEIRGLPGAVYEITAAEDIRTTDGTIRVTAGTVVDTVTTVEDGTAATKELFLGKYTVTEIAAPQGMVLNTEPCEVVLSYAGQEVAVTEVHAGFSNLRQKAALSLTKAMENDELYAIGRNDELAAVAFGLYAAQDISAADGSTIPEDGLMEIVSVGIDGHAVFSADLPFGRYYVKEVSTHAAYALDDTAYPVEFSYASSDLSTVAIAVNEGRAIENRIRRGSISGLKTGEDGSGLEGAVLGLYQEGGTVAVMQATSGPDGSFAFADVPCGNYVIREIKAPENYVLSETPYSVIVQDSDKTVELTISNTLIRGSVQLTKVDRDYPDNHLTGAVFEVYADTNEDGKLGKGDELTGTLTELSGGVYRMDGLVCGVYFAMETTAPAGFVPDENAYMFAIRNNGEAVIIENSAGVGFLNAAQTGSLRIEKTSEDKVLQGFTFRVEGTDSTGRPFSREYTTDEKGQIILENLRVGNYTVTEVQNGANAKYVLPAGVTVTIQAGATTVAKFHNALKPVIPDVPKTGDSTNIRLWGTLSLLFLACSAVTAFFTFRKKK